MTELFDVFTNEHIYLLLAARKRRSVECGDNGESNDKDGCDCNDGFEFDSVTCVAGKSLALQVIMELDVNGGKYIWKKKSN